ncbi:uncharacterized protein si:dkey-195m11.11 [Trichomycterus rosablanca]|uniref:uncharacterized protein si:dkey-195m11.11 n=1 Tax=Trichomycterus rosablanca TaxID=2290929 RepID=UPI002F355625
MVNQGSCAKETLCVTCTAAVSPPKLSVSERDVASYAYVRTEESVTIICSFEFPSMTTSDWMYVTFTHNGQDIYSSSIRSGESVTNYLSAPVPQGEYTCYIRPRTASRRMESNSLGIYIFNPPPAGPVIAAVITTVAGVAILIFVCVCRTSDKD